MPTRRARTTRKENQSLKESLGLLDLPVSRSNEGKICQVCHACKSALSSYHPTIEEVHPSMQRMTFTSLENHMLDTIFRHLLLEFTEETKLKKDFILISRDLPLVMD